jgi:hypothetical protein
MKLELGFRFLDVKHNDTGEIIAVVTRKDCSGVSIQYEVDWWHGGCHHDCQTYEEKTLLAWIAKGAIRPLVTDSVG